MDFRNNETVYITALFLLALVLRLSAAYFNYGFLALDDYYLISTAIPAQAAPPAGWQVENIGFRSPLPKLIVWYLGQAALYSGIEDPLNQIRFVYAALSVLTFPSVIMVYMILKKESGSRTALAGLIFMTFYFLIPYVSSRTLLENMSAPFLMVSVWYLLRYHSEEKVKYIYYFVFSAALASVFRFQAGVIVFVILYYILRGRRIMHLAHFAAAGGTAFAVSGLPDLLLQNSFHRSLISYFLYNIENSSSYGVVPFWAYILLFAGLSLPPSLFASYRGFNWQEKYRSLLPALWVFSVFVFIHSLIPHKEERFMLPVLPLFILLITPAAEWLFLEKKSIWRITYVSLLNFPLLAVLTFYPAQNNTIGLVRFFHENHSYSHLVIYGDSLEHLPISYAYVPKISFSRYTPEMLKDHKQDCGTVIAVREDYYLTSSFADAFRQSGYREGPVFSTSLPESLITRIIAHNKRRLPIHTFLGPPCRI